ncbi:zinc finger, C3HC4 type (RING finger) protein [Medicago truncatula]|uniref:RBR-type E3 ubiquitin transferase n=1 Tax=Medicago truncatula TaxID=3880 RepID=A0A072VHQ2_MEDTR|nr:zinc finger, C3HC4 type (RING finger) protein [Medicago truncatula]
MSVKTTTTTRDSVVVPPSTSTTEVIDVETFQFSSPIATTTSDVINLSDIEEDDDDDVKILNFVPKNTSFGKRRRVKLEKGESSKQNSNPNEVPFFCEICTETKTTKEAFFITGCNHAYCSDCVVLYVRSKIEENVINVRCPESGCSGLLEAEECRAILPVEDFDRWGKALCEAMFDVNEKFYCPFPDCSALLINDGTEAVLQSECPNCRRLFCAQCKVSWHDGIGCSEFQKLNADERGKNDIMLMKLAKEKQWKRCPNCKYYVAKSEGCLYMKCRYLSFITSLQLLSISTC